MDKIIGTLIVLAVIWMYVAETARQARPHPVTPTPVTSVNLRQTIHLRQTKQTQARIDQVAFSPDGKRAATAAFPPDTLIRLWDVATGQETILEDSGGPVESFAFSGDGSWLAVGRRDHTIQVWDVAERAVRRVMQGHTADVYDLAWSPDGQTLASVGDDETLRLWRVSDGSLVQTLDLPKGIVVHIQARVAWSPDGQTLATSGNSNAITLWRVGDGQIARKLAGHSTSVSDLAWSPDGRRLASAGLDATVRIWDPISGRAVGPALKHPSSVVSLAWSRDGQLLASGDAARTIRVWDAGGNLAQTLDGHTSGVRAVVWSQDGKTLVSAATDNTIRLWQAR